MEELGKRVQVLEDIEAIKKLKFQYAKHCDDRYNPEKLGKLFTEDAIWDSGGAYGAFHGRERIKEFFAGASGKIIFACHQLLTSSINVEGNKAKGEWYAQTLGTLRSNKGFWTSLIYEDEYKKIDGKWYISSTRIRHFFMSPYEGGWAKDRHMSLELD